MQFQERQLCMKLILAVVTLMIQNKESYCNVQIYSDNRACERPYLNKDLILSPITPSNRIACCAELVAHARSNPILEEECNAVAIKTDLTCELINFHPWSNKQHPEFWWNGEKNAGMNTPMALIVAGGTIDQASNAATNLVSLVFIEDDSSSLFSNCTQELPLLPETIGEHGIVRVGTQIVIIGGQNDVAVSDKVYYMDMLQTPLSWQLHSQRLRRTSSTHAAVAVKLYNEDFIYTIGGQKSLSDPEANQVKDIFKIKWDGGSWDKVDGPLLPEIWPIRWTANYIPNSDCIWIFNAYSKPITIYVFHLINQTLTTNSGIPNIIPRFDIGDGSGSGEFLSARVQQNDQMERVFAFFGQYGDIWTIDPHNITSGWNYFAPDNLDQVTTILVTKAIEIGPGMGVKMALSRYSFHAYGLIPAKGEFGSKNFIQGTDKDPGLKLSMHAVAVPLEMLGC